MSRSGRDPFRHWGAILVWAVLFSMPGLAQEAEEAAESAATELSSEDCTICHEESSHGTAFPDDLSHSAHGVLECLDCHSDKNTDPHLEESDFSAGLDGCRDCHVDAAEQYQAHGRAAVGEMDDMPLCSDCHGDHDILPSAAKLARTHPVNLPSTCGRCHEDLNLTKKHDILIDHPIQIYEDSVHGKATTGGVYVAATCNDCHSAGGTAHKILSPGYQESSINHFNIPKTCGKCHKGIENDFWEGIHGQLVERGETDAPVCTHCHGEHGIISPDDPRSPVSRARVAESTCTPCHDSAVLNEKYGLASGRLSTFIDSYHGLKSKAGDTHVANCASCHGVHRILPSSSPASTIHPDNLRETCGHCHPGISTEMASIPIHGVTGEGLRTPVADIVENLYIIAIIVIIGLMVLHWLLDWSHHLRTLFSVRPQIRRMRTHEVWQHAFLMVTFIVLVISGFALRFSEGWFTQLFFGWARGFELRGVIHRYAAVLFIITAIWHSLFLLTTRGRAFVNDMMPSLRDFVQFKNRILYNLGRREHPPEFGRFSYVEKAEYWALVWGSVVMIGTGLFLWFDNWFIQYLPKGFLDVSLVIHYWEAWLATLAILVWHMYSTVFSPAVYPMNPSWLTGTMPEAMYKHEHSKHLEEARRESRAEIREEIERFAFKNGNGNDDKTSAAGNKEDSASDKKD